MKLNPIGANQTVVNTSTADVLFSYRTPVAACVLGKWYKTNTFWSVTTSKHINRWLEGRQAEVKPQEFFDNLVK